VVNGNNYSKAECYQRALELDPACAPAWMNLAVQGGGTVNGSEYSYIDCAMQLALLMAEKTHNTFNSTLANPQLQLISL